MEVVEVTVGLAVRDGAAAREWYDRLLGRPPEMVPAPGVLEYRLGATWLQLYTGEPVPGAVVRLGVRHLLPERDCLRRLGFPVGKVETIPGVIRYLDLRDPDGNRISLYELLNGR
ncbi:MAG TPA: VOC family protein [Thermoplasmata archaeon]|nr:VOC family protein [Thermoplasmata archaeon]